MITDKQYSILRKMCAELYKNSKEWLPYIKDFLERAKEENSNYKGMFEEIFPKLEFIDVFKLEEHTIYDDMQRRIFE